MKQFENIRSDQLWYSQPPSRPAATVGGPPTVITTNQNIFQHTNIHFVSRLPEGDQAETLTLWAEPSSDFVAKRRSLPSPPPVPLLLHPPLSLALNPA